MTFDAVTDRRCATHCHAIPTTFAFAAGEMEVIEKGVANIFGGPWCGGRTPEEKEGRQRIQQQLR